MKQVLYLFIYIGLALTMGCTKPDRDDEAVALSTKIVNEGLSDANHALERVDSAEQVGVCTAVRANTIKAIIYTNADRRRMATYYAEKATSHFQMNANPGLQTTGDPLIGIRDQIVRKMRIALLASYFVQRKIISRLNSH